MDDFTRMDHLFKHQSGFGDFVALRCRQKELDDYDRRIAVLQRAKATLETTPVYALTKQQTQSATRLCHQYGWTEDDAADIVEAYMKQTRSTQTKNAGAIATGVGRLGQALFIG